MVVLIYLLCPFVFHSAPSFFFVRIYSRNWISWLKKHICNNLEKEFHQFRRDGVMRVLHKCKIIWEETVFFMLLTHDHFWPLSNSSRGAKIFAHPWPHPRSRFLQICSYTHLSKCLSAVLLASSATGPKTLLCKGFHKRRLQKKTGLSGKIPKWADPPPKPLFFWRCPKVKKFKQIVNYV